MPHTFPSYLKAGETARLFPVLSTTSKEGRATAILLACMSHITEFSAKLLSSLGQRLGKRTAVSAYTEVVFRNQEGVAGDRPDGLLVVSRGTDTWRALIESKIGASKLVPDQIERYRALAKEQGIDCVITISNQFASRPANHPAEEVRKSRSRIPVFHWSWMHILTEANLLMGDPSFNNEDKRLFMAEFIRFLSHKSTDVHGFDRMPSEWTMLNRLVSSGGSISARSTEAVTIVDAWHQETRDLSLILSRLTDQRVSERIPNKHVQDPGKRQKDDLAVLRDKYQLTGSLVVPYAAAPLEIVADMKRRCIDVGMTLKAPEDKRSTKARVNWLMRQLKAVKTDDIYLRLRWPGGSQPTQYSIDDIRNDVDICSTDRKHLTVQAFHVFCSRRLGGKFAQQVKFVSEIESIVPEFYRRVGSKLVAWKRPAPEIKNIAETEEELEEGAANEAPQVAREESYSDALPEAPESQSADPESRNTGFVIPSLGIYGHED